MILGGELSDGVIRLNNYLIMLNMLHEADHNGRVV
jgi:hypothetical protein